MILSSHFSKLAEPWVADGIMAPKTGISQRHFSHQEGSSLNRKNAVWASIMHLVRQGVWHWQKLGGLGEQFQIQQEASSREGKALLFHDGMKSGVVNLLPAYYTLLAL